VDRSICPGKGGPVYQRMRDTLYDLKEKERPMTLQFHAGLGGKEVRIHDFEMIGDKTLKAVKSKKIEEPVTWV
jgi:hypothetical protein